VTPAFSVPGAWAPHGRRGATAQPGQPESDMLAMSLADLAQGRHSSRFKQNIEAMVLEARADARHNAH